MEQRQVRQRREGAILFLPFDVIVNVLSRLPARSLARFQCVSKQWRSVINCNDCDDDDDDDDANYFLAMQQKNASARPKIIDKVVRGRVVIHHLDDEAEAVDKVEDKFFDLAILADHRLSNSVNGMDFHLLNPTTREVSKLPDLKLYHDHHTVALGFDESTRVYKLVRIIYYKNNGFVAVLTLGVDQEWRVGSALPMRNILDGPPVCLHGVLHWSAHKRYCYKSFCYT